MTSTWFLVFLTVGAVVIMTAALAVIQVPNGIRYLSAKSSGLIAILLMNSAAGAFASELPHGSCFWIPALATFSVFIVNFMLIFLKPEVFRRLEADDVMILLSAGLRPLAKRVYDELRRRAPADSELERLGKLIR